MRLKTTLALSLVAICLLWPLVSGHWLQKQIIEERVVGQAVAEAQKLAEALADIAPAGDVERIRSFVERMIIEDPFAELTVFDAKGAVLARRPAGRGDAITAPSSVISVPIRKSGVDLGKIDIAFAEAGLQSTIRSIVWRTLAVAAGIVMLVIALGYGVGTLLTRWAGGQARAAACGGGGAFSWPLTQHCADHQTEPSGWFDRLLLALKPGDAPTSGRSAELERLALVARKIDEGVLILDENRIIEWANEGCERLTGYSQEELIGKEAPAVFKRENISPEGLRRIIGTLKQGKAVRTDARYYRKDGSSLWVDLCLTPILDEQGRLCRFVAVQRDVTEQRELLEELDAHRHHLEKLVRERTAQLADKAEELETALAAEKALNKLQRDFVSMVSHEFRTPLAIIDGTAQRIGRRLPNVSPEDATNWLDKIRNAVTRMTRLIESTLAASRMDAGEVEINPVDCDLSVILTGCCERQKELSPHHDIKLSIDPRPMMLRADPGALEQVFTNLLSNAVKYAPDRPEIQVRAWREENQLLIEVQDHGLGMDEVDLAKLFKRFFRAKTSTGIMGTGIGLNLIKMLIERHGGAITVTSELDQGSTFGVRLPVNGPQLAKPASRASADRPKDQPAPTKADAAALAD